MWLTYGMHDESYPAHIGCVCICMSACRRGRAEQQQREAERKGLLAQVQQAKKELNEVRHPGPQLCPTAAARWPWSHDSPPPFSGLDGGGWDGSTVRCRRAASTR